MWYIWENDVIYTNSQPRPGTREINRDQKFSEITVQKIWSPMIITHRNLARSLGKTYCVWKCKKMDIENLMIYTDT